MNSKTNEIDSLERQAMKREITAREELEAQYTEEDDDNYSLTDYEEQEFSYQQSSGVFR